MEKFGVPKTEENTGIDTQKFIEGGWKTNRSLEKEMETNPLNILRIVNKFRESNPEYFISLPNKTSGNKEYYSPELVNIIKESILKIQETEKTPDGWKTAETIAREYGATNGKVSNLSKQYRDSHPEYFNIYKNNIGQIVEHYSPELIQILQNELSKFSEIAKKPEGWRSKEELMNEFNIREKSFEKYKKIIEENADILHSKEYKQENGKVNKYYSPEFVEILGEEIQQKNNLPDDWKTRYILGKDLGVSDKALENIVKKYKASNPEYFKEFYKRGKPYTAYSPELVDKIKQIVLEKKEIGQAPEGWETNRNLSLKLKASATGLRRKVSPYRETNPEYFHKYRDNQNITREYYSPELVRILVSENRSVDKAPDGWKTNGAVTEEVAAGFYRVKNIVDRYRENNPEYFSQFKDKRGKLVEHYSPELVDIIKKEILSNRENKDQFLKTDFENFVQEIIDEETDNEQAKKIGDILKLLPGNAHDIILKYHPEYRGLNVEYVNKIIADYLGDFLMVKREWKDKDIEKIKEVADIENIHEALLFNLKNACLAFINKTRKYSPELNEQTILENYFAQPEMQKLAESGIPELEKVLVELKQYYASIFELREKKPGNVVEFLKEGRIFPDINQLVNIQEMKEKKKMLIADEMGLGKSASAIMAKEYLGLKNALVVMPSNVLDTWGGYLSDKISENGKQIGYFKKNLAPKVLSIASPEDIERLENEVFDYVLISQERIGNPKYTDALEKIDFDMMIMDEVHKFKNIYSGVRSESMLGLAEKIQGEGKYMTLLSGTPAPNKVTDIGVLLKLLYPEKYGKFDNKEMVNRILYSDLIDLRTELLMKTQMKELVSSIEMPALVEKDITVELSIEEREIYEILLEEDELTASEKITAFRQFLLNPEILKVAPGFVGQKIEKLDEMLNEDLKTQDKIIVFVNGYVEGVIRGDANVISKLNLPPDVVIEEIHGEVEKDERKRIESELKSQDKKMVVFVSGQTADVGVDFSGADGVIFYNEPWSKFDKKQELARVYREGLKDDLTSKTLITRNSIEEGIRRYINAKEKAIEKLLRGISNTDAEKKLLRRDSEITNANIETNSDLSKEYLSDWEKLMVHFGEGFEAGEKRFKEDLDRKGKEYADLYKKLGRLTYQGNNARATATLLEKMISENNQNVEDLRILDIASGPEMLKEASREALGSRIFSLDINTEHFIHSDEKRKTFTASYLNLPAKDDSLDYVNLGFAFHQTSPIKYHKKNYERLQVLAEMNRTLKIGGKAVISMLHNIEFTNEEKFGELIEKLGFKSVENYSGDAVGGQSYKARFFTLQKVGEISEYKSNTEKYEKLEDPRNINELAEKLGREFLDGLDMDKVSKGTTRLKDQRRIVETIHIGGEDVKIIFNEKDNELFENEKRSIKDGENLREQFGSIRDIPISEIKRIGFERKLETPGYFLLYKIIKDGGAVIIRDARK